MLIVKTWKEYELIDAGNGEKLERWGDIRLQRPDNQVIWPRLKPSEWEKVDAIYHRSETGGGRWEFKTKVSDRWVLNYKDLKFYVEPTGFKHTGLFPEQAVNWDFMMEKISHNKNFKVLNLFAYTGAASIACAVAGAEVVHIDASKGMNEWAKDNAVLNKVENKIRFITDDVKKFVQKEIRRGNVYDGIIMDPPVYGRGPQGELWEIEKEISDLIQNCAKLLSNKASFFIVNTYTSSISLTALENLLNLSITNKGRVESGELGIPIKDMDYCLPCGIYGKWSN